MRNTSKGLVGLFALAALAQTLAYYVYLRDDPGNYNGAGAGGDQLAYIELAQQILHGTWQGAVHYMPGLPVVIAFGQALTGDPRLGIALLQGLLYAGLVIVAARLSARTFARDAAPWAAALVGLNPALGYYAAQALTEFLTAVVLVGLVAAIARWAAGPSLRVLVTAGVLIGAAGYLRSEYLGLVVLFGAIVVWLRRHEPRRAVQSVVALVGVTALVLAPWVVRYTVATGRPALYNESPFSNLMLMGTWFRVFDEQTFAELQRIETAPGTRDEAIARAATVGPRPELSRRYMEQARGPYERPLPETLGLMGGNIQLNLRQYLVNHVALAPVLIWAGHTPIRQADAPHLPATGRYTVWGIELLLLVLALWQAILVLRSRDSSTVALGLSFVGLIIFLTAVHTVIAVDERFTTPALPLIGVFAGARLAELLRARQRSAISYAA
ncbi:MAG TPA: hypothetical protein VGQ62_06925 [Chloroflexota bacterium]|jgi:4-amino-4-deoxy-L-arabinose transferase-like glycosyltransferase|nr:hypothetical protein [Chloroflexota bacterium]